MKKITVLLFLIIALTWSCRKDFIVEDISKKTVTVNAPANNTATTINLVSFWWDVLDGAEKYNLQIVKPDFSKAVQLVLDTNITLNKFNFSLTPGSYQWRLKAFNAGHSTAYQIFNLKIDTTSDLSEQLVNLESPVNNAVTGNNVVTFKWSAMTVAKKYRFQINDGLILDTTFAVKSSFTYSLPAVKNATTAFTWNVKALNDASESQFNAMPFTVTIDFKGPGAPVQILPADAGSMTNLDTLKWNHAVDAKYDSVFVAYDSLFTNVTQLPVTESYIPVSEFVLAPSVAGTYYYWRVRSFDVFGNPSAYSYRRKFKLSP